ncbi:MAG: hypothetical protein ACFCUO_04340 [Rhodospirillales bacterium]
MESVEKVALSGGVGAEKDSKRLQPDLDVDEGLVALDENTAQHVGPSALPVRNVRRAIVTADPDFAIGLSIATEARLALSAAAARAIKDFSP